MTVWRVTWHNGSQLKTKVIDGYTSLSNIVTSPSSYVNYDCCEYNIVSIEAIPEDVTPDTTGVYI